MTDTRNIAIGAGGSRHRRWLVIACLIMVAKYNEEAGRCRKINAKDAKTDLERLEGGAETLAERIQGANEDTLPFPEADAAVVHEGLKGLAKRLDGLQGTLRGAGWDLEEDNYVERAETDAEYVRTKMIPDWSSQLELEPEPAQA